ncbi:methyl-CpG-binding domain protein 3 isoform X2 [Leopardus geoffroyi]|uniref:methyl-CpG-binding domain protein 3 isoform X2 n=1 Tax=Leopardus geoffroyi TaxID=46844 RepID=UPI001E260D72|nr:methyl-CpG-binding domain protein 3 isoform X2 [Leopardus geoffroyi]
MERKSPSGKKFRSKPQLARYLGGSMDLSTFDFRTGKLLMSKASRSRQRVRYDSSSQVKGKPDLNTALPVRQTASIFKQPVTKITNHPSNKVKSDPQKAVEQPRQLFWEKKLSGLNAFDIAEELVKTMDLPKGLQGVGPGCTDETLLSAIASALHTSTMPITGQLSAAVEKNPGVWLNTAQPLCKAFMVTDEDIRCRRARGGRRPSAGTIWAGVPARRCLSRQRGACVLSNRGVNTQPRSEQVGALCGPLTEKGPERPVGGRPAAGLSRAPGPAEECAARELEVEGKNATVWKGQMGVYG